MAIYVGSDLGGTNNHAGIVNPETESALHSESIPTQSQSVID